MAEEKKTYQQSAGNTSQLLALMAKRRAEEEQRRDLEMEFKVNEGTVSFDDQIKYLSSKTQWYARGTSKYQQIQNDIQSVGEQRDETDLQYRYRIGEVKDQDLLEIRQQQLSETKEGGERYYKLQNEIYDIQQRMQQKADNESMQQALLDYKYNYTSANDHLTFLQDRLDYMNGEGYALYTDEERSQMQLKVNEQEYVIVDLNNEMEALTQDTTYENGIDKLAAGEQYVSDLQAQLENERDPLEQIRLQGRITAQVEINRQLGRDRQEAEYRISYARHDMSDEEYLNAMTELADSEINPDKKLQYDLEVGQQFRKVQEKNFQRALGSVQNEYAENQNERTYLSKLEALKEEYGEDSEFGFQLNGLISSQTRRVLDEDFKLALGEIQNGFEVHKNSETYLADLEYLKSQFGEDSVFSFEINKLIAQQTGDVQEEQFNSDMAELSNKLTLGEITEAEYQQGIEQVYIKYPFTDALQYQTKKDTIVAGSQRNEMENAYNTKLADLEAKKARGQISSKEYESALADAINNAESYGYGNLLNIPQYANRVEGILANVQGENVRTDMNEKIQAVKNRYAVKDINYEQYLNELKSLDNQLQQQHPDLYNDYFKSTMKATIADATGDKKTKDFQNKLADLKRDYNNHKFNKGPIKNAKAYQNELKKLLGKYNDKDPEFQELSNEISTSQETIIDMEFTKDYQKLEDAYKKNQTAKGAEKFQKGLQDLKKKSKYASRQDIASRIDSQLASMAGNVAEANFYNDIGKFQKQLQEGKISGKDYHAKMQDLDKKYFGKGVDVKLSENLRRSLNAEIRGESGSVAYQQYQRKADELGNKVERGDVSADAARAQILKWQQNQAFGSGDYINEQLNKSLTGIETTIGQKRFRDYTKRQQDRASSAQEEAARQFRSVEQEFQNVQSAYSANKTSFDAYESARKRMAEAQRKLEDYQRSIEKLDLPDYEFEKFKPGIDLKDIELPKFTL